MFQKLIQFFAEVKAELLKVNWPTRQDVTKSTSVVLVAIGIIGMFLWAVDMALQGLVSQLMK